MNEKAYPEWQNVQRHLKKTVPGFVQYEPGGALTLELADEDWQLEVTPQGQLICQAGYALQDMQSLLSDGTAEDLGSDELAKQAKFYIQQVVAKYRDRLKQDGFIERTEMNDDYVAVFFERNVDLKNLPMLDHLIAQYQQQFGSI
ncbi:MAG: hypothetical protein VX564_03500 [Nitrospirota bacterium]|nr:hypothetical protein [Nitrospirota bacterium]